MPRADVKTIRVACCLLFSTAVFSTAGMVPATTHAAVQTGDSLQLMSNALVSLTDRISPAVVEILVNGYGPDDPESQDPGAPIGRESSQGSGVIVDSDGYIVTNYHVIAGQQRVEVVITPRDTREPQAAAALRVRPRMLPATVVGYSRNADLAVLKVDATGLPTIPFAQYMRLRQGQLVLALGSPIGLKNSVSLGVVSAVLRQDDPEKPMVYIQTDAAINPGNSGGALVDVDGNLVGINCSIITQSGGNEGIGFAIPSGIVRFVYRQIRQYGYVRSGYIGASIQTITPKLASALDLPAASVGDVIVSDVAPGSPAEGAGLKVYDRIRSIDGAPVDSVPTFTMDIYLRKDGDRVRLDVTRGTEALSLSVPVTEIKPGPTKLLDLANPATDTLPALGIVGIDLSAEAAKFIAPPQIGSGVLIAAVTSSRRADEIGLQQGDIIHALNTSPVTDMASLRSALRALKPGDPAALQVERDGMLSFITFEAD